MTRLSFTEHPASVGENYFAHLRHALGFSVSMLKGSLAVFVHAIFPFLFARTGSGIIASLHTRMITHRAAGTVVAHPRARIQDKRPPRARAA
jgi:hypothetical protein